MNWLRQWRELVVEHFAGRDRLWKLSYGFGMLSLVLTLMPLLHIWVHDGSSGGLTWGEADGRHWPFAFWAAAASFLLSAASSWRDPSRPRRPLARVSAVAAPLLLVSLVATQHWFGKHAQLDVIALLLPAAIAAALAFRPGELSRITILYLANTVGWCFRLRAYFRVGNCGPDDCNRALLELMYRDSTTSTVILAGAAGLVLMAASVFRHPPKRRDWWVAAGLASVVVTVGLLEWLGLRANQWLTSDSSWLAERELGWTADRVEWAGVALATFCFVMGAMVRGRVAFVGLGLLLTILYVGQYPSWASRKLVFPEPVSERPEPSFEQWWIGTYGVSVALVVSPDGPTRFADSVVPLAQRRLPPDPEVNVRIDTFVDAPFTELLDSIEQVLEQKNRVHLQVHDSRLPQVGDPELEPWGRWPYAAPLTYRDLEVTIRRAPADLPPCPWQLSSHGRVGAAWSEMADGPSECEWADVGSLPKPDRRPLWTAPSLIHWSTELPLHRGGIVPGIATGLSGAALLGLVWLLWQLASLRGKRRPAAMGAREGVRVRPSWLRAEEATHEWQLGGTPYRDVQVVLGPPSRRAALRALGARAREKLPLLITSMAILVLVLALALNIAAIY